MLRDLLLVGAGGAVGSALRYFVNIRMMAVSGSWPLATFSVNIIGSFIIGVLMALWIKEDTIWRLLLITGFCGGFTTFSTFSFENLALVREGQFQTAVIYMLASLFVGIGAVALGFIGTQRLIQ